MLLTRNYYSACKKTINSMGMPHASGRSFFESDVLDDSKYLECISKDVRKRECIIMGIWLASLEESNFTGCFQNRK